MTDNELLLIDRIEKIKSINQQYDLENNAYLSFSGGKDSTALHYLLDMALPDNKIPRVFFNTGIEYPQTIKFVKELAKEDDRIQIINSNVNIKQMLEKDGYPFKSKEHSIKLYKYKHNYFSNSIMKYINNAGEPFQCPNKLTYQFKPDFNLKISDKCCYNLKKKISEKYKKESKKKITITGMISEEGGFRKKISGCIITQKDKAVKFHPLLVVNNDFINWFIDKYNIKLNELYYPPFNFVRTGCIACPYALNLQNELDTLQEFAPNLRKQAEKIWKPVYDEYRRIGYRLNNNTTIFDFIENDKEENKK